jgi:hypothetical protein
LDETQNVSIIGEEVASVPGFKTEASGYIPGVAGDDIVQSNFGAKVDGVNEAVAFLNEDNFDDFNQQIANNITKINANIFAFKT